MIKLNQVKAQLSLDQWKNTGGVEGKNSDVWIARDTQLDQVMILKKITKESLDRQNVLDYFSEAKILNESKHPHIMPIIYSAEDDKNIYITMPFYEQGSLNSIMNKRFLTTYEIIKYAIDFLSGLLFIHTKDLVHLDIKPTNIIINRTDRAMLTDFGLSKYLNEHGFVDQEWSYVSHRSPEAYTTKDRTRLDDIYQAGLTLYRMCYGNESFKEQYEDFKLKHKGNPKLAGELLNKGHFPDRKVILPHIPKKLNKIIVKMINPDIGKRYEDVLTIINDLSKIDEHLDWKYAILNKEHTFEWKLEKKSSVVTIRVEELNGNYLTTGIKCVKPNGTPKNQNKIKNTHSSLKEAFEYVQTILPIYE